MGASLFTAAASLAFTLTSATATEPLHLQMGRELVSQIQDSQANGVFTDPNQNNVEINRYGGSWGSTYIQFADPENDVLPGNFAKCASFVTLLLRAAYDWNWSDHSFYDPILQQQKTTASPSSYRYEALIEQNIGFASEITRLDEVLPGDVITMVYVDDDSGHTGLVNEVFLNSGVPYPEGYGNSDPNLYGTWFYELDILDCSGSDHTNDTREFIYNGDEYDTDGVGIGTMGILVNADYEVVGYTWSLPSSDYQSSPNSWLSGLHSRLKLQTVRAVKFGRLDLPQQEEEVPEPQPQEEVNEEEEVVPPSIVHEAQAPQVDGPAHLTLGLELIDQIVAQQSQGEFLDGDGVALNRYGGSWSNQDDQVYIEWADPNQGVPAASYSKCTSFVTLLLQAAYNWNWYDYDYYDPILDTVRSTTSPSSYRYVAMIKQTVGFEQQIVALDEALPGDIIASQDVGDDSGHTMVFLGVDWNHGKAYPENQGDSDPAFAGTTYYEMHIMDVTKSAHSTDTRRVFIDGAEEETGGAGVGVMGVLLDENMEIVGHTWSLPSSDYHTQQDTWLNSLHNRLKLQTEREMVLGRLPANP